MTTDNPTQLENKLEPCPWCKVVPAPMLPEDLPPGFIRDGAEKDWQKISHAATCFIALLGFDNYPIHRERWPAWNSRAPVVASQGDDLIRRQDAVSIARAHDRRHSSGYRCYEGDAIADKIAALPAYVLDIRTAAQRVSRAITEGGLANKSPSVKSWDEGKDHIPPSPSSPVPPGDSHQVEQWKRDLVAAGWVAESAIKWRAPDSSLWRGPYGAWKELQRQRENCSGCAVSRAGVGRCRIHEPVKPAATPAPVVEQEPDTTLGHLRVLLDRYAQPCSDDCEHSQCPLLRELHTIVISDTLELARLKVRPIVDRERAEEFVGDLMNMRLRASAPTACDWGHAIEIVAATRQSSLWNREGYDGALTATIEQLRAAATPASVPGFRNTKEAMEYAQRNNIPSVVPATPSSSLAAREAAEELERQGWLLADVTSEERDKIIAIIQRYCSPVPAAGGDEEREFLAASVAVWREIDRLSALPEGYKGLPPDTDPRKRELAAWERYRATLDAADSVGEEQK